MSPDPVRLPPLLLLGVLGCALQPQGASRNAEPRAEVIWSAEDPHLQTGDVSPDGRSFTDIDWDDGTLRLVDLATGRATRVSEVGYDAGRYAWRSAFSRDGRRIAVSWFVYDARAHELAVLGVDGSDRRVLVPASDARYYVEPLDWSPDDREVAVALQQMGEAWHLGVVTVATGALRVVARLDWQAPGGGHPQAYPHAEWSPDGRFIAYDYPRDPGGWARAIHAVPAQGGAPRVLFAGPGSHHLLAWSPDGDEVLIYSDRSGHPGVWRVPVRDGRATGEPVPVAPDLPGLLPLGLTARGYLYGVVEAATRVHTVAIDLDAARLLGAPASVDAVPARRSMGAAWSPRGDRFATIGFGTLPRPSESLTVRSATGAVLREAELPLEFHAKVGTVRWVDEGTILLNGTVGARAGIHALRLETMEVRRLPLTERDGVLPSFQPGPGGREVFLYSPEDGGVIAAHDARTGARRIVGPARGSGGERAIPGALAISPDGREIAYLTRPGAGGEAELRALATTGGAARVLWRGPSGWLRPPVTWAATGHLVSAGASASGEAGIRIVRGGGADAAFVALDCCGGSELAVRPDGGRIAFVVPRDRGSIRVLQVW
jgi:hypothetical protein